ncbi:MAG: hypothetical protein JXA53_04210 [Bacteroidales bacterium]|nr:hypothetical protein [Bacteroidales bacterium]
MKNIYLAFCCFGIIVIHSCKCNRESINDNYLESALNELEKEEQLENNLELVKEIVYSMPSPLETAMMIKRSGANFNSDNLLDAEIAGNYITLDEMAIALGMYSADLSYASMFNQTQHTINYMHASRALAEKLGIFNIMSDEVIQRLENNVNNRDIILEIISESLMNTNQTLHEENRENLSVLSLVGSWLEGMHIAIETAERANVDNSELKDRILEQKLAIDNIYRILLQYKNDRQMKRIFKDIKTLKKSFDLIKTETEKVEKVGDKGQITLRSKRKFVISDSDYAKLKKSVITTRNRFVKNN